VSDIKIFNAINGKGSCMKVSIKIYHSYIFSWFDFKMVPYLIGFLKMIV